jgi:hypothetical protein
MSGQAQVSTLWGGGLAAEGANEGRLLSAVICLCCVNVAYILNGLLRDSGDTRYCSKHGMWEMRQQLSFEVVQMTVFWQWQEKGRLSTVAEHLLLHMRCAMFVQRALTM